MMNFIRSHFSQKGFTIVEVIVIVMVVSILAGISVVSYGQWRRGTSEKAVKSDLVGVANAMNSKRNFGGGYPPLGTGARFSNEMGDANAAAIFVSSDEVTLVYRSGDDTSFCIDGQSKKYTSIVYRITQAAGEPVAGGC